MTRNAECTGHPHTTRLGCGWKGERFPDTYRLRPQSLYWRPDGKRELNPDYIDAIAKKACPRCGGIVMPVLAGDEAMPETTP